MLRTRPENDFDLWGQQVTDAFCPMQLDMKGNQPRPFRGEILDTALDRIVRLARVGSDPIRVQRDHAHIGQMTDAFYLVKFQLEGHGIVKQLGREALLRPGDFFVCTTSDPYLLDFPTPFRQAVLTISETALLGMYNHPERLLGLHMAKHNPANVLLSQFVRSLSATIEHFERPALSQLEGTALDLLLTSFEAVAATPKHGTAQLRHNTHMASLKRIIQRNLRNPNLSPAFLAEQRGISKRYLHMLFQQEGISVGRYIQGQRLRACARLLARSDFRHISATSIALEWGFADAPHFSRCFKAAFGLTPKQYRLTQETLRAKTRLCSSAF